MYTKVTAASIKVPRHAPYKTVTAYSTTGPCHAPYKTVVVASNIGLCHALYTIVTQFVSRTVHKCNSDRVMHCKKL